MYEFNNATNYRINLPEAEDLSSEGGFIVRRRIYRPKEGRQLNNFSRSDSQECVIAFIVYAYF